MLTKKEILDTKDWYEADYANSMEGYFWIHKSILNDGYTFYMRRCKSDGCTTIIEDGKYENKLFEGYILTLEDLHLTVKLLQLKEI